MAEQIMESSGKWYQECMRVADAISSTEKQLEVQDYYYICFMHLVLWINDRKARTSIIMKWLKWSLNDCCQQTAGMPVTCQTSHCCCWAAMSSNYL